MYRIVGESGAMEKLKRSIQRLSRTTLPILLLGETGTGKELVARAIHRASGQAGGFVVVDCSSLVETLTEAELFGHKKGAFTGAFAERSGLIEGAADGTAFFDEIGELPLALQSKLLRLAQERQYRPVGGSAYRSVSLRIIAATNRDLAAAVRAGTFREDLYYRISGITIRVPPLRAHKDDIPLLFEYFLRGYPGASAPGAGVLQMLMSYGWPGNVRQLEHCARCMAEINACRVMGTGDLECPIADAVLQPEALSSASSEVCAGAEPTYLADVERRAIVRALDRAGGDVGRAAVALGVGRTTVYRRLKEYQSAGLAGSAGSTGTVACGRGARLGYVRPSG